MLISNPKPPWWCATIAAVSVMRMAAKARSAAAFFLAKCQHEEEKKEKKSLNFYKCRAHTESHKPDIRTRMNIEEELNLMRKQ